MSKKYTAKEYKTILRDVLCNAFEHMESLLKEIKKLDCKDSEIMTPDTQHRLKSFNITLTLVNDIIHPAHNVCRQFFKGYEPMIDMYVKNQALAFEKKLVPECYCHSCDPDGSKSRTKAEELRLKMEHMNVEQTSVEQHEAVQASESE